MSFSHSVLLVGGTGYIGSHVAVALIENGAEVTILDDLSNSSPQVIDRIAAITGRTPRFVQGDMRDPSALDACFSARRIDCVILLAGLKSVPQSLADPLTYYDVNIGGAIAILSAMQRHGCQNIVFSSSATVYGTPRALPIREDHPLAPTNPYGETKAMIERILLDHATARAESGFRQISLRYFNPVGAHASGLIGEAPRSSGGNLFPMLAEATQSSEREFRIFGTDLATPDGTAERDFIHSVRPCRRVAARQAGKAQMIDDDQKHGDGAETLHFGQEACHGLPLSGHIIRPPPIPSAKHRRNDARPGPGLVSAAANVYIAPAVRSGSRPDGQTCVACEAHVRTRPTSPVPER